MIAFIYLNVIICTFIPCILVRIYILLLLKMTRPTFRVSYLVIVYPNSHEKLTKYKNRLLKMTPILHKVTPSHVLQFTRKVDYK